MISFVIPVLNEEEGLLAFYQELSKEQKKLGDSYETLFIDDGSIDGSLAILKDLLKKDKNVRLFSFRRNRGKSEALSLGFQKAKGDYVVTLDADLQDRPSEVHKLLDEVRGNWDVVSGWRKNRQDKKKMVWASKLFNLLVKTFWGLSLHDYNCGLKAYTSDAAKSLRLYGGFHRFIPLIAFQEGFTVTEVVVEHDKRRFGKSKYGFSKVWKDLPDIFSMIFLAKYSKRPLHFFGFIGLFLMVIGVVILLYLLGVQLHGQSIGRRPLLMYGILSILAGVQIFLTGFLGDLIINSSSREMFHQPLRFSSDKTL
ncbi:MAG TPA: glycosyltransferase family 2 protein [Patescibacteria group bacterium]|nr:glycosyltransferase family 2 protein [Patescibacteria group bacterium]